MTSVIAVDQTITVSRKMVAGTCCSLLVTGVLYVVRVCELPSVGNWSVLRVYELSLLLVV